MSPIRVDSLFWEIQAKTGAFDTALKDSERKLQGFSERLLGNKFTLERFFVSAARVGAATAAAIGGATVAMAKLAERGGEVLGVQRAFTRVVGDSEAALRTLRTATQGLISDFELMQGVNRAVTLGSAENAEQFAQLAQTGIALGRALGVDARFAVESLNLGIGRQSRLILDNLGLIVSVEDANRKYAASLGKTVEQLTEAQKREAFRTAALEAARRKVEELGAVELTAADNVTRFRVAVQNARDSLARMVAESAAVAGFFDTIVQKAKTVGIVLEEAFDPGRVQRGIRAIEAMTRAAAEATLRLRQQEIEALTEQARQLREQLPERFREAQTVEQLRAVPFRIRSTRDIEVFTKLVEVLKEIEHLQEDREAAQKRLNQLEKQEALDRQKAVDDMRLFVDVGNEAVGVVGQIAVGFKRTGEEMEKVADLAKRLREEAEAFSEASRQVAQFAAAAFPFGGRFQTPQAPFAFAGPATREPGRAPVQLDPEKVQRDFAELAREINLAVRGVIDLGRALGGLSDEAANTLGAVGQLAESVASLAGAIRSGSTFGIISSGLGLLGGLASLFGESPEDRRRREILEQNTEAIQELTKQLGEFGLEITGQKFAQIAQAVASFSPQGVDTVVGGSIVQAEIARIQREFGLSLRELQEFAATLGITLPGLPVTRSQAVAFAEAMRQLNEAIQETELTRFAETFVGQLDALRVEFELFDISDPIEQLQRLRDVFADPNFGAPALREALAGLDLSTPEGRRLAEQRIQELFRQLQTGTLTPEQLGGLTPQQFLDALRELEQLLDRTAETAGETQDVRRSVQITELQADRLLAFQSTQTVLQERMEQHLAGILAQLGGTPIVQPPTAGELAAFQPAGSLTIGTIGPINVTVAGGATPAETGDAVGREVIRAINQKLGEELVLRRKLQGLN